MNIAVPFSLKVSLQLVLASWNSLFDIARKYQQPARCPLRKDHNRAFEEPERSEAAEASARRAAARRAAISAQ
ncbi:MAG: hypothetical protein O7G83_15065 [Proteobacteria bacterium]|nr:hypothetical protein [Pseudomonadota bacterium]